VSAKNGNHGFWGVSARLMIARSVSTNNALGGVVAESGDVMVGQSTITGNGFGVSASGAGGFLYSYGNNISISIVGWMERPPPLH